MKKFFVGFMVGGLLMIFLMISIFEMLHIKIEKITGLSVCSFFLTASGEIFGMENQNAIRITYKIFAWPIKTILINGVERNVSIIES